MLKIEGTTEQINTLLYALRYSTKCPLHDTKCDGRKCIHCILENVKLEVVKNDDKL